MKLKDLFKIEYGQREYHSKAFLEDEHGPTPLISSGASNDGFFGRFNIKPKYKNVISVASTGSVGWAFYHGYDCCIDDNCLVLVPNDRLSDEKMLFLTLLINKDRYRYMYGRQVTPKRIGDNGRVNCQVVVGGDLSNNKGINLLGGGLSAAALTEKDKEDIKTIAQIDCDYVAVSFPRCAEDLHEARRLLAAEGCYAGIVAKVERAEAVATEEVMDEIILASDVVMVARGDLGVEIGDANLPAMQKRLIKRARSLDRIVITATQMMESMIENAIPTRAEVFDVANAVYDGTDAIMLSAETASGKHPVKAVEAMHRICMEAEKQDVVKVSHHRVDREFQRVEEAIAMSAMYMANHTKMRGIATLTESGTTPLLMSRISSAIPIFALSSQEKTLGKTTLYRGVTPIYFSHEAQTHVEVNRDIIAQLRHYGFAQDGDQFIITKGDLIGTKGGTNDLKVVTVGHVLTP